MVAVGGPLTLARLLAWRLAVGVATAQGCGAALLVLVLAVEAADEPRVVGVVLARLPALWALAAPALSLLGATWAAFRLRSEGAVLALGACGIAPAALLLAGALAGAGAGAGMAAAEGWELPPAPGEWVRGDGGWWRDGVATPDVAGEPVGPARSAARVRVTDVVASGAGGALGVGLGLFAGPLGTVVAAAILVVVEAIGRGLWPAWGGLLTGGIALAGLALTWRGRTPRRYSGN